MNDQPHPGRPTHRPPENNLVNSSNNRLIMVVGSVLLLFWIVACTSVSPPTSSGVVSDIVSPGALGYELYQAHCAACHGRSGRGDGIAAMALNTPPRDFRSEPFRYVSTLDGIPTDEDLIQTIKSGRVRGEMPESPWLSDQEIQILTEYVRELNRLGWVDKLTAEFADEEGMTRAEIEEIAQERVTTLEPIVITMPGKNFRPRLEIGRELYLQSCASCHGATGRGDGLDMPLDELGRPIAVRDLVREPIRGGSSSIELFKRIRCGVPGTPMPAQEALTDDQVWQLVYYTKFLMGHPRN